MAERIRAFAWESTPLGPLAGWSDALISTVNMVLAAPVPIQLLLGPELTLLYNDGFRNQLAEKHPGALGSPAAVCWAEVWADVIAQVDAVLADGTLYHVTERLLPMNLYGTVQDSYWTFSYSPVYEMGRIVGILNLSQNVTGTVLAGRKLIAAEASRSEAEENKRRTEERLRLALEAANGVGTWDWDVMHDRVFSDRRFAEAYGVDPAQAEAGTSIENFLKGIHPDDRERVGNEIAHALTTGEAYSSEYRLLSADGSVRWTNALGRCTIEDGRPVRFSGVTLDITGRRKIESALIQSEKLAAVGRLASSIAHEINNPLEAVTNLLYLVRASEDLETARIYGDLAEMELRRVAAITSQTLRFHKQSTVPIACDAATLLESAVSIYQSKLSHSEIVVERRFPSLPRVTCLDGEIRQVLSNLVGNAIDAMHPAAGRLLLQTRASTDWRTGRRGLTLTVADTGPGMTPEVVARIFEAFYSTKGNAGTGLGLWISHEIIERHRGRLLVRSSQRAGHRGTVFTIFLPFESVSDASA